MHANCVYEDTGMLYADQTLYASLYHAHRLLTFVFNLNKCYISINSIVLLKLY